ncbi:MAG: peptidyl-prolyl cis-trans isomerase, partial [Gammaproteobacteria bacterium]
GGRLSPTAVACSPPYDREIVAELFAEHVGAVHPSGLLHLALTEGRAILAPDSRDPDPAEAPTPRRGLVTMGARSLIIAQAYMQKKVGNIARPTQAEITDYYNKNPELFANRKQFDMKQLVVETKDLTDEFKQVADSTKSLDDLAAWMDEHKVKYARTQASRSTSDLPPEMSAKLKSMPKNQPFIVKEGPRSLLVSIVDVKDAPASLEVAAPQIERFLFNKKNKDAADAELARLRASAKIEYLNKAATTASATPAAPATAAAGAPAAPATVEAAAAPAHDADAAARGVAGLK